VPIQTKPAAINKNGRKEKFFLSSADSEASSLPDLSSNPKTILCGADVSSEIACPEVVSRGVDVGLNVGLFIGVEVGVEVGLEVGVAVDVGDDVGVKVGVDEGVGVGARQDSPERLNLSLVFVDKTVNSPSPSTCRPIVILSAGAEV